MTGAQWTPDLSAAAPSRHAPAITESAPHSKAYVGRPYHPIIGVGYRSARRPRAGFTPDDV